MSERDDEPSRIEKILRQMDEIYGPGGGYHLVLPRHVTFEQFCEQFGVVKPKFREYEPTDEDKRILSELGIEA